MPHRKDLAQRPDITESLFYDKYYVIKKARAQVLAQEAIKQLTEENENGENVFTGRKCQEVQTLGTQPTHTAAIA